MGRKGTTLCICGGIRGVCPQFLAGAVDNLARVVSEAVRQLFPSSVDNVDPLDLYLSDARPCPAERPWLMCNMIASVDGATALGGLSGDLGGPADKAVFRAIRATCDWVLVASATAVAETYRVPTVSSEVAQRRVAGGRGAAPRLAIVTASGVIDPTLPAFSQRGHDDAPPLVVTGRAADGARLQQLDAEVVRLDDARPEPQAILEELGRASGRERV